MPTNKNAVTRYKILDKLLSNRYHNYSLDDLTNGVNERLSDIGVSAVSRRCIEKDIAYLESEGEFLVEIERYSTDAINPDTQKTYKKRCLRYENPAFSIFKKELSDDEKSLLADALSLLGQFDGLPNFEGLEQLRKNLKVDRQNKILSISKNPIENSTLIGELFTAISNKQVVEIDYRKFTKKEEPNCLIVHPYLLKEYNRRWHLFAMHNEFGTIINLALDRIKTIKYPTNYVYKESEEDIAERFEEIVGLTFIKENPVQKTLFWVSDESKDYVATKPLHESQKYYKKEKDEEYRKIYPKLQGGSFFAIECRENYELISLLSSYGKNLIVLSPESLKEKIIKRIDDAANFYLSLRI